MPPRLHLPVPLMPGQASPWPPLLRRLAGAAMGLAGLATPGWAAEALPFQRPAGWRLEPAASSTLRQLGRDFGGGHAAILFSGPLARETGLEASLARVLASLPGVAPPPEPPSGQGTGTTALGQRLAFRQWAGGGSAPEAAVLEAVVLDDGARRLALVLWGRGMAPRHALQARDAFGAVARSATPGPGAPPPPVLPQGPAGGLEGAFTGLRFDHRPNGEGETETLAQIWVLMFDPGGLFSRVVPAAEGGVPAHCRAWPADCGRYTLLGGGWLRPPERIRLHEGSGPYGLLETRELAFARQEAALRIDDTRLNPAAPLPPGTRLQGLWSLLSVSAEQTVRRQLRLDRDGRFRRDVETDDYERPAATSSATGRYRVEQHRLLLEAEDGRRESLGLLQPDPDSDAVLFIGGEAYLKRAPAE